ncbi:hypothetical protein [Streptomyces puniciscabiei]|uniref:hypothetical protein n=1 Tax=Streptomyces puniciscabiei TaxID=164348 RepID=UPI00332B723F
MGDLGLRQARRAASSSGPAGPTELGRIYLSALPSKQLLQQPLVAHHLSPYAIQPGTGVRGLLVLIFRMTK